MERQNPWWKRETDPAVDEWEKAPVRWFPDEVNHLSLRPFSLNFLSGPRQVGKTTALKLLIRGLLKSRSPESVFYYSCDELTDHTELGEVLDGYLGSREVRREKQRAIFLDEVTYVRDWWRAVKSRIDDGTLRGDSVTVTGSVGMELIRQRERFPGRRGNGVDVTMRPRSFRQYVSAVGGPALEPIDSLSHAEAAMHAGGMHREELSVMFRDYLQCGGFPRPIIDMKERGKVGESSIKSTLDWLRADWMRAGRSDGYMKEVIAYILRASGTPVSWLNISRETSLGSPHTAQAYVETLEGLLAAFVLVLITPQGRLMHRLNRKIHFADPLLYNAFAAYTRVDVNEAAMVEGTVASHLSRRWETYYWRNGSEVDAVALSGGKQVGVETKWGFKKGTAPRHLSKLIALDVGTVPAFLAIIA